ncbi:MAG: PAS domain S-box protein [Candidatus Tectomicrobia bacterium]|uniref:PAS domain S-box protein n=1 Tax=Tectimicrobiota bacterium TaxID=2528274 RepID=A0A933GKY0_UNCTE|nr:PAS domain S-box protein [Candidatus Tectomicrobia bacterium]
MKDEHKTEEQFRGKSLDLRSSVNPVREESSLTLQANGGTMEDNGRKVSRPQAANREYQSAIGGTAENKGTEKKLINEREILEMVTQCVGVGLNIISPDYRVLWVNQIIKQLSGEVEGEFCYQAYHKKTNPCHECAAREVFKTGKNRVVIEQLIVDNNGNNQWLELIATPLKDKGGNIQAVLELIVPINERKQAEEALREKEEKYRTLFEQSRDAIYITSTTGELIDANQSMSDLLGYSKEEFMNLDLFKIYADPEDRRWLRKELDEKGSVKDYYVKLRKKDGTEIDSLFTSALRHAQDGSVLWHQGIIRNITDYKLAEESVKRAEQRYRDLFEEAPVMYVITRNVDGVPIISDCNNLFLKSLGFSRDEVLEHPLDDFYTTASRKKLIDEGGCLRALKNPFIPEELELLTRTGGIIETQLNAIPEIDDDGKILGTRAMFVNIRERKRMENELKRTSQKLQKALEGSIQAISSALEIRDPYTAGHQTRVSQLACNIARELGLSEDQVEGIRLAGLVHDIGKISVPSEILTKPGRISEMEFNIMKSHCQVGYDILKSIDFPWAIAQIALQHHERLDGSGYPTGLSGKDILLEARILCVADTIEAMASHRPYRAALGIDQALKEISENRGTLYDSEVVDACMKIFYEKEFKFDKDS